VRQEQRPVSAQSGLSPDDVFQAQSVYQDEPEVVEASRELRNAALPEYAAQAMGDMESMMGMGVVPEGMTAERVVEMTRLNASLTIARMRELVAEIKSKGLSGQDAMQQFQTAFLQRAKSMAMDAFGAMGITPQDFAASVMHFMDDPEVQAAQMETQNRLMLTQQLNMMELTTGMSREEAMDAMGVPAGFEE
jgi:hypothetical protein